MIRQILKFSVEERLRLLSIMHQLNRTGLLEPTHVRFLSVVFFRLLLAYALMRFMAENILLSSALGVGWLIPSV